MSTHPLADWLAHESGVPHQRPDADDDVATWHRQHPAHHFGRHRDRDVVEDSDGAAEDESHLSWSIWAHEEDGPPSS